MTTNEQVVANAVIEETADSLNKVDYEDFTKLQTAAKVYLDKVEEISQAYESIVSKGTLRTKITAMYKQMREETYYTREMLRLQHEFETALNEFMGREIFLTYVAKDGSLIMYDDAGIGKLYATATANKGRGNIFASSIVDSEMANQALKEQIDRAAAMRKEVYTTAIERYHKNEVEYAKNYNPSAKTFYWWAKYHETLGGWTDPIVNEGPIAEGYAGAVINEDPQVMNTSIETSLQRLWEAHIQKDSIGAIIKGDVVMDSNNNLQFAIKKGSFSTAMVGQYLRLAYNILQLKQLTIEDLKRYLPGLIKINKISSKIIEVINEDAEEQVVAEVEKYMAKLNK